MNAKGQRSRHEHIELSSRLGLARRGVCKTLSVALALMMSAILMLVQGCIFKPDAGAVNAKDEQVIATHNAELEYSGAYGELKSFDYAYGSFNGGSRSFSIYPEGDSEGDKFMIRGTGGNGVDLNLLAEVDRSVLDSIAAIIEQNNIVSWDGFHGRDELVQDGYSFGLNADFDDKAISASGYHKKPRNYDEGHAALSGYLETLAANVGAPSLDMQDVKGMESIFIHFEEGFTIAISSDASGPGLSGDNGGNVISRISYEHGDYIENHTLADTDVALLNDYLLALGDHYNRFKDEPSYTGYQPNIQIQLIDHTDVGTESSITYRATIDQSRFADEYQQLLEASLVLVGKDGGYIYSEEFKEQAK